MIAQTGPMHPYLIPLYQELRLQADPERARTMRAYMKDHFPFLGIGAPVRRSLLAAHVRAHGRPTVEEAGPIAEAAFALPEREMHYCAVDLLVRQARKLDIGHLPLVERLITKKSWWDTVDSLAINVAGMITVDRPAAAEILNDRWINSDNLWLVRSAILLQNRWCTHTNPRLLYMNIKKHAGHKDFFVRKAIGWALREYSKTDPGAVRAFVRMNRLSPLSLREATKLL